MAGLFIDVQVDEGVAQDREITGKLEEVCPVDIFGHAADGTLVIVEENLDECTLCDLCLEAAPKGSVRVVKRYAS